METLQLIRKWQRTYQITSDALRFRFANAGLCLTANERRLAALRDRYKGRRFFVIGNGPSLKKTDLSRLTSEISIASNGIFLLFDQTPFRPTVYTIEDQLVAEDRAKDVRKLKGMTKIFPTDCRHWLGIDEDTTYVHFDRGYPDFPKFTENCLRKIYWGGTVTVMNLQLAYYMGAREIYLIGIDHSYKKPKEADEVQGNVILSRTEDENHFHPDYFGPGFRWHDPHVERMEQGYVEAKRFVEANGGKIYNATIGGHLEVFPRVNYEDLF